MRRHTCSNGCGVELQDAPAQVDHEANWCSRRQPPPTERYLANQSERLMHLAAIVSVVPAPEVFGYAMNSRKWRQLRELYDVPSQDIDLWHCGVNLGAGDEST